MTERMLRFVVEKRYRKPPPAPYENPWRACWSFDDRDYADECARDDGADDTFCEYRVRDTQA